MTSTVTSTAYKASNAGVRKPEWRCAGARTVGILSFFSFGQNYIYIYKYGLLIVARCRMIALGCSAMHSHATAKS